MSEREFVSGRGPLGSEPQPGPAKGFGFAELSPDEPDEAGEAGDDEDPVDKDDRQLKVTEARPRIDGRE